MWYVPYLCPSTAMQCGAQAGGESVEWDIIWGCLCEGEGGRNRRQQRKSEEAGFGGPIHQWGPGYRYMRIGTILDADFTGKKPAACQGLEFLTQLPNYHAGLKLSLCFGLVCYIEIDHQNSHQVKVKVRNRRRKSILHSKIANLKYQQLQTRAGWEQNLRQPMSPWWR